MNVVLWVDDGALADALGAAESAAHLSWVRLSKGEFPDLTTVDAIFITPTQADMGWHLPFESPAPFATTVVAVPDEQRGILPARVLIGGIISAGGATPPSEYQERLLVSLLRDARAEFGVTSLGVFSSTLGFHELAPANAARLVRSAVAQEFGRA